MPNSSQFVYPMIAIPEVFSRWTTVASKGNWKALEIKQCKGSVWIRALGGEVSLNLLRGKL